MMETDDFQANAGSLDTAASLDATATAARAAPTEDSAPAGLEPLPTAVAAVPPHPPEP